MEYVVRINNIPYVLLQLLGNVTPLSCRDENGDVKVVETCGKCGKNKKQSQESSKKGERWPLKFEV
jgi:hypothetical protein